MSLLTTQGLTAHYGDFQALFGVDITLNEGETIAIIGANGAGKTTLMRSLSGVSCGTGPEMITLEGRAIGGMSADEILPLGLAMVPEGQAPVPIAQRRGKPTDRHLWPQGRRLLDPAVDLTSCSRSWPNAATTPALRCQAVSSRWSPSAAR